MARSSILKGLGLLGITFIIISFAHGVWISTKEYQEKSGLTEKVEIKHKDECLEINVNYPKIIDKKSEKINQEIVVWTNAWIKDVEEVLEDYKKSGYICNFPYQLFSNYYITKESNDILSFYIDYYQFTGGAHGSTTRKGYSIDRKLGKKLVIKELFKKGYNYKTVIDKEIKEQISADKERYFDEGTTYKGITDEIKFYIKGENLVVYYGQYEIAPYASGIPEFNIPLSKFNGNLVYDKI